MLYGALLAASAWLASEGPGLPGWSALALVLLTMVVTAVGAAPLHGRLADPEHRTSRVARLLRADQLRCALAVAAALVAVVSIA